MRGLTGDLCANNHPLVYLGLMRLASLQRAILFTGAHIAEQGFLGGRRTSDYVRIAYQYDVISCYCTRGEPMKPHGDCTRFNGEFSFLRRRWMRSLLAAAVTLVLFGHSISAHAAQGTSRSAQETSLSAQVGRHSIQVAGLACFLLRGVLNIFSLGLDQIAARLKTARHSSERIPNYLFWSSVADEAAAEYKSGRTRTIDFGRAFLRCNDTARYG